jgi:hypothetical protein
MSEHLSAYMTIHFYREPGEYGNIKLSVFHPNPAQELTHELLTNHDDSPIDGATVKKIIDGIEQAIRECIALVFDPM